MKVSFNWLNEYVNFKEKDPYRIAEILTINSAEIDSVIHYKPDLQNMVVGKIEEIKKHPNADRLKICLVNNGEEVTQVVCGGSNLYRHMLVAFAKPGAKVRWHGEGDLVTIQKTSVRGEESVGMICASDEIGLEKFFPKKDELEIVDLTDLKCPVGQSLIDALELEDHIFDIENTALTHRPDLFSHCGFARECVANKLGAWKKSETFSLPKIREKSFPLEIKIKDPALSPRYSAFVVKNVPVRESPFWLRKKLAMCGIRPINTHVDITNYVMLECGMPTHAFDLDRIKGKKVILRETKGGEEMVTLDGVKRSLPPRVIVFEDGEGIFDLCGIMGGERSGIDKNTHSIWFHAPVYEKVRIRRAAIALAHRTDASTIYEKGVPISSAMEGIKQGLKLIFTLYPHAEIAGEILDLAHEKEKKRVINIEKDMIRKVVGIDIPAKDIKENLHALGFKVSEDARKKAYTIEVPPFRHGDVSLKEDIIEEIIRTYGINKIHEEYPMVPAESVSLPLDKQYIRTVQNELKALSFVEANNYSFLGTELLSRCGVTADGTYLKVKNAITEDTSLMRQSLLPRLLDNTAQNLRFVSALRIYELGRVFRLNENKPEEKRRITGVLCDEKYDFYAAKGCCNAIFHAFGIYEAEYIQEQKDIFPYMHPGRTAKIVLNDALIGHVSEIHPAVLQRYDIKQRACFFDIDFELLVHRGERQKIYRQLPKFPSMTLDLNIIIPEREPAEKFRIIIEKTDEYLIKKVSVIDEYRGASIPEGKRSITLSIVYNAFDRTLTDEEVKNIHEAVIRNIKNKGAELRI